MFQFREIFASADNAAPDTERAFLASEFESVTLLCASELYNFVRFYLESAPMQPKQMLRILLFVVGFVALISTSAPSAAPEPKSIDRAQVPTWSQEDMDFFLHGSMSTEVIPEIVLRAFFQTYPDLFPNQNLSQFGLIPDPKFGWPIGFSRKNVTHLGGQSAIGVNCAACHVAEITSPSNPNPVRVLGVTSHFDAEAYFGTVTVATFRTADPANMRRFASAYLSLADPLSGEKEDRLLEMQWRRQEKAITAVMSGDPMGSKNVAPGELHLIAADDLRLNRKFLDKGDLAAWSHSILKLFHNMRAALHIPDKIPEKAPPSSGPGRNDAFGLLSAGLLDAPQPYAPVKYGLVWNVTNRHWVHWDGNTRSPIGRNLLASLGLGAPLHGKHGELDFASVKHQTDLSELIQPPRYPFAIDQTAAKRGSTHYQAQCVSCHGGVESDARLYSVTQVGTDPLRAQLFTQLQADRFNKFLSELETTGYVPGKEAGLRSTGKYWAASMGGVWARSPYLHNGSVRTMQDLLMPPEKRPKTFHRGSRTYDESQMGYTDAGTYLFDTAKPGNSNSGHNYGTDLTADQKRDLIEYLKTL